MIWGKKSCQRQIPWLYTGHHCSGQCGGDQYTILIAQKKRHYHPILSEAEQYKAIDFSLAHVFLIIFYKYRNHQ